MYGEHTVTQVSISKAWLVELKGLLKVFWFIVHYVFLCACVLGGTCECRCLERPKEGADIPLSWTCRGC